MNARDVYQIEFNAQVFPILAFWLQTWMNHRSSQNITWHTDKYMMNAGQTHTVSAANQFEVRLSCSTVKVKVVFRSTMQSAQTSRFQQQSSSVKKEHTTDTYNKHNKPAKFYNWHCRSQQSCQTRSSNDHWFSVVPSNTPRRTQRQLPLRYCYNSNKSTI